MIFLNQFYIKYIKPVSYLFSLKCINLDFFKEDIPSKFILSYSHKEKWEDGQVTMLKFYWHF